MTVGPQKYDHLEPALDKLFREYREQCPDSEPSANFMPQLWQRIDASRSWTISFRRLSQAFVTAAAAICLLGLYLAGPSSQVSPVYMASYVDVLDEDSQLDSAAEGREY